MDYEPKYDFNSATAEDEGYYLYFNKLLSGARVRNEGIYASFFVNGSGIHEMAICESYAAGEVYDTPERLTTTEEVLTSFDRDNAKRHRDGSENAMPVEFELMYTPMRRITKQTAWCLRRCGMFATALRRMVG
ncbi:MAG: hypothetical protein E7319_03445 [Clostridiales bacterium]|nr:hypothetical protein [Clostridiales bacterium]